MASEPSDIEHADMKHMKDGENLNTGGEDTNLINNEV